MDKQAMLRRFNDLCDFWRKHYPVEANPAQEMERNLDYDIRVLIGQSDRKVTREQVKDFVGSEFALITKGSEPLGRLSTISQVFICEGILRFVQNFGILIEE